MIKNLLATASILLLFLSSCSKDDAVEVIPSNRYQITGDSVFRSELEGIPFRVYLPNAYNYKGDSTQLMIICHGNGAELAQPSQEFIQYAANNNIAYAVIRIQDQSTSPYSTNATGWGNEITLARTTKFYNELIDKFNFKHSVILTGVSMGGLTMGNLAYRKAFPIKFCLGIGPVPDLKYFWEHGQPTRKPSIRAAYEMAADGSDDAKIDERTKPFNWRLTESTVTGGVESKKFPYPLFLYAGANDIVFKQEFGGTAAFTQLTEAINRAGGRCTYTEIESETHASPALFTAAIPTITTELRK